MKANIVLSRIVLAGLACLAALILMILFAPSIALQAQAFPTPTPTMTMTPPPSSFDPFTPPVGTPTLLPTVTAVFLPESSPSPTLPAFPEPTAAPLQPPSSDALPGRFSSGERMLARVNVESLNVRRLPSNAPAEVTDYPYTESDIRELPELGRYVPRLGTAIDYLQAAREPLLTCGVISPSITVEARNSAINARVIFDATLGALDNLEETIYQYR
jgi:hypothetical protein